MKEIPFKLEATYSCQSCQKEFITGGADVEIVQFSYPVCSICFKNEIFDILSRYTKEDVFYMLKCLNNQNSLSYNYKEALYLVFDYYLNLFLSSIKPVDTDMDTGYISVAYGGYGYENPMLIGFRIHQAYPVAFGRLVC